MLRGVLQCPRLYFERAIPRIPALPPDERRAIEQWLESNITSPSTGEELEDKKLRPNHMCRGQIKTFLQNHRSIGTGT